MRRHVRRMGDEIIPRLFDSVSRAAADADLLLSSGVPLVAPSVAEYRGIPNVYALFCPAALPNSEGPPPIFQRQTFPRWVNAALWRAMPLLGDVLLRPAINRGRAGLGLPPTRRPMTNLMSARMLVAADPELAPLAAGAPGDKPADGPLDFSRRRRPRAASGGVYSRRTAADLRRVRQHGREKIAEPWSVRGAGRPVDRLPPDRRRRLGFARRGTGGFGRRAGDFAKRRTTSCFRASRPRSITAAPGRRPPRRERESRRSIVPHVLDQFYWARRVELLGLGPQSLPVSEVSADALATRMAAVLNESRFGDRARELGPAGGRPRRRAARCSVSRRLALPGFFLTEVVLIH